MGDSRSGYEGWQDPLIAYAQASAHAVACQVTARKLKSALGSNTVALRKSSIDADLLALNASPYYQFLDHDGEFLVLINLGAVTLNDAVMPDAATWKSDYQYIIDAIIARLPTSTVYIVKPWYAGYTANANTMAGWIDDLITANAALYPGQVILGHDERVWMEGGDNGATMTTDGLHYSTAGMAECAAQWKTILGY